jgi:hypothetical protein
MPRTQPNPIGNDVKSSVLQQNLEELFQFAHDHPVRAVLPSASEGASGDMIIVDDGTNVYACFRTSRGWFRTPALTAI